jgi:hypothetical protein
MVSSPIRRFRTLIAVAVAAGFAAGAPNAKVADPKPSHVPVFDAAFWKIWGDGQAELSSYDLTYPRYGKPRTGTAVTIFVTEPFSFSSRVKADPGRHPDSDVFPVMKLNLVEDFRTGVYDYNEQTSSFLSLDATRGAGALTKISFSSQEWCGHSWLQVLMDPGKLRFTGHSYFDGEADRMHDMISPPNGIHEEQLMFWARGMANPVLAPGESVELPYLPSLQSSRHSHKPLTWGKVKLTREATKQRIGQSEVEVYRALPLSSAPHVYFVETAGTRRILRWQGPDGECADLIASERMKYWEMNKPGDESVIERLGLRKRPPRTM